MVIFHLCADHNFFLKLPRENPLPRRTFFAWPNEYIFQRVITLELFRPLINILFRKTFLSKNSPLIPVIAKCLPCPEFVCKNIKNLYAPSLSNLAVNLT